MDLRGSEWVKFLSFGGESRDFINDKRFYLFPALEGRG